jgi:DNA (cytosine-5)-methyltransferase 1
VKLLETHPCQGGATAGYIRAGWDVTAVDIGKRHQKYSPAQTYVIADAATYIAEHGHEFDAIHVSPPCQWYTRGNASRRGTATKWERTIPPIREALLATGKPYVLENVKDAAWDMQDPATLCGCQFDLSTIDTDGIRIHLQRPRLFETNWPFLAPRPCDHSEHEWVAGAYGGARRDKYEAKYVRKGGYVPRSKDVVKALLGVEHDMTWEGLFECVPPAYTHYVGHQLRLWVASEVAA